MRPCCAPNARPGAGPLAVLPECHGDTAEMAARDQPEMGGQRRAFLPEQACWLVGRWRLADNPDPLVAEHERERLREGLVGAAEGTSLARRQRLSEVSDLPVIGRIAELGLAEQRAEVQHSVALPGVGGYEARWSAEIVLTALRRPDPLLCPYLQD